MSYATFPSLPGLKWDSKRSPMFNTIVHKATSGREVRAAQQLYPLWHFELSYEVLRQDTVYSELTTLAGFFLARRGQYDSFLYTDPNDNSVTDQQFGVGDGITAQFQLTRPWGNFVEPVMNGNALTNIKKNGTPLVLTTDFTVDVNGLVTFVATPAVSDILTWTGTYYYRCRFEQDEAQFNEMMRNLWELETLSFIGSPSNKV